MIVCYHLLAKSLQENIQRHYIKFRGKKQKRKYMKRKKKRMAIANDRSSFLSSMKGEK